MVPNIQFIGYYTIEGPTGCHLSPSKEEAACTKRNVIQLWPKTTVSKVRYKKGRWVFYTKTKQSVWRQLWQRVFHT